MRARAISTGGSSARLPATYITDYAKAKPCTDFLEPPWVSWLSYAAATVGDEWSLVASSPTLCKLAAATAGTMQDYLPANDGSGYSIIDMQSYAIRVGRGTDDEPEVPRGALGRLPARELLTPPRARARELRS